MNNKLKPAILCGGALGVFLVLTGLIAGVTKVGPVGCCNCVWPIAAGLLATLMFIKGSPTPAKVSDGAVVGLLAGLVGGLINLGVGLPIQYLYGMEAINEQMGQMGQFIPASDLPKVGLIFIIVGIISFIIFLVLSTIGGLIAVPIFEKRKDPMAPPPQDLGGSPGSSGAGM